MSFDTPNGTHGARQPGHGRLERWGNRMMVDRIRRKGSSNGTVLVLVTIGSKTGLERATPVRWFPGPGDSRLVVASAAGAARNPAWYYNLAAHPDRVRIDFEGHSIGVTAEQLHGVDRDKAWRQVTSEAKGYAKYVTKTDRVIPIIRLTPKREA